MFQFHIYMELIFVAWAGNCFQYSKVNSLASAKYGGNFESVIFECVLQFTIIWNFSQVLPQNTYITNETAIVFAYLTLYVLHFSEGI